MKKLRIVLTSIVGIFAFSSFLALIIFSFFRTGANEGLDTELVISQKDNIIQNLVGLLIFGLVLFIISKLMSWVKNTDYIAIIAAIIASAMSIFWVMTSKVIPVEDQAQIVNQAIAFNHGDFSGLAKGAYVGLCQHQLGMITLTRVIFKLVGEKFLYVQLFSAMMVAAIIWSGYRITKMISGNDRSANLTYILLSVTYAPMYFYVPFVYGEVISIGFMLIAVCLYFENKKKFYWMKSIICGVFLGLSIAVRQNAWIIFIALLVIAILEVVGEGTRKDKRNTILEVLIIACSVCSILFAMKYGVYGGKIPEDSKSIPALLYIAMGCNTDTTNPGNYNGLAYFIFSQCGYDVNVANQEASVVIKEFAHRFFSNPRFAYEFVVGKFGYQWNSPMEQSMVMNRWFDGEPGELVRTLYYGDWKNRIEQYMNIWQLFVYLLSGVYIVKKFKLTKQYYFYLIPIAVMGDVCFSMIWEAKSRYTLPFVMLLIPIAATAYGQLIKRKSK